MPSTPPHLALPVSPTDHAQGPVDAPLTLVEYGDYECPNCVRTFSAVRLLQQELGERLRFVYRHFARSSIHAHASVAAEAAEAAGAQGKFWEMHDLLYARTEPLGDVDYDRLAVRIGIDLYRFRAEMAAGRWARRVRESNESAIASGVTRTPTFFLNGDRLEAQDYESLKQAIGASGASPRAR